MTAPAATLHSHLFATFVWGGRGIDDPAFVRWSTGLKYFCLLDDRNTLIGLWDALGGRHGQIRLAMYLARGRPSEHGQEDLAMPRADWSLSMSETRHGRLADEEPAARGARGV